MSVTFDVMEAGVENAVVGAGEMGKTIGMKGMNGMNGMNGRSRLPFILVLFVSFIVITHATPYNSQYH